ncbi:MAG TPA: hypothetical protein VGF71_06765, partial [Caulobacteraceae bacterium]
PTTCVWAAELSERAILDAIRGGRVFIDVEGSGDRLLELTASCGDAWAMMGEALTIPSGASADFTLHGRGLAGAQVDIVMDGRHDAAMENTILAGDDEILSFQLPGDGERHWIRADIRSADASRTLMIGNPIYLNR